MKVHTFCTPTPQVKTNRHVYPHCKRRKRRLGELQRRGQDPAVFPPRLWVLSLARSPGRGRDVAHTAGASRCTVGKVGGSPDAVLYLENGKICFVFVVHIAEYRALHCLGYVGRTQVNKSSTNPHCTTAERGSAMQPVLTGDLEVTLDAFLSLVPHSCPSPGPSHLPPK